VEQELVREETESMGHKIRNLWNIRHRVTGYPFSLFFLDIEPAGNNEIYRMEYLQNMRVETQPPHKKQNNIPQCEMSRVTAHTDRDA
jgi:hypothetical protein